ncbi:MAG: pyridoxal-phosphate dependent enzyme [Pseudonocardiaceae bacterium]|nr:pyridoxal-phosphate dependent enzyme [Pseudonocardiaceae bacterium]
MTATISGTVAGPVRAATVLDGIGDTPLVELDGVWAKLEFCNPSGSVKARVARYIVDRAEAAGLLSPGDILVEASSGNTGNALAMVAAARGYRVRVIMPRGMSTERLAISRAFGAEIEMVGDFHVTAALARAEELGRRPGFFATRQFSSEWNVEENRTWLGPEIVAGLPAPPDAFVMGVGTGGTLVGVGQAFKAVDPRCRLVAVEPAESRTLARGEVGPHLLEGISDGFVPAIIERHRGLVDDVVAVRSDDAVTETRRIAREHGIFVGPTSGAHLLAARRLRARHPELGCVVTVLADEGEKYLSSHFAAATGFTQHVAAPPETRSRT